MSAPIANCKVEFSYQCPKSWEELSPVENDRVRYCHVCKEKVHLVSTMSQVHERANRGECIAISYENEDSKSPRRKLMGMPAISRRPQDEVDPPPRERSPWWRQLFFKK